VATGVKAAYIGNASPKDGIASMTFFTLIRIREKGIDEFSPMYPNPVSSMLACIRIYA
jgi:hypothetical protein